MQSITVEIEKDRSTGEMTQQNLPEGFYAREIAEVRSKRDNLLKETDVWALSDRTMTAKQTQYRSDLRDITDQVGFYTDPMAVAWPTKPE